MQESENIALIENCVTVQLDYLYLDCTTCFV